MGRNRSSEYSVSLAQGHKAKAETRLDPVSQGPPLFPHISMHTQNSTGCCHHRTLPLRVHRPPTQGIHSITFSLFSLCPWLGTNSFMGHMERWGLQSFVKYISALPPPFFPNQGLTAFVGGKREQSVTWTAPSLFLVSFFIRTALEFAGMVHWVLFHSTHSTSSHNDVHWDFFLLCGGLYYFDSGLCKVLKSFSSTKQKWNDDSISLNLQKSSLFWKCKVLPVPFLLLGTFINEEMFVVLLSCAWQSAKGFT
jgi:hypothetical protein